MDDNEFKPMSQARREWINNKLTVQFSQIERPGERKNKRVETLLHGSNSLIFDEWAFLIFLMGFVYGLLRQFIFEMRRLSSTSHEIPSFFSIRHGLSFVIGWMEKITLAFFIILSKGYYMHFLLGIAIGSAGTFGCVMFTKHAVQLNAENFSVRNSRQRGS